MDLSSLLAAAHQHQLALLLLIAAFAVWRALESVPTRMILGAAVFLLLCYFGYERLVVRPVRGSLMNSSSQENSRAGDVGAAPGQGE